MNIYQAESVFSNVYGTSGTEKLRLVKQTAGENSVEFTHDIYGRVLTETRNIQGEAPLEYSYEYNGLNKPSKICYPNGLEVEYGYDNYGYPTQVKADGQVVYNLDSCDGLTTKASFLGKLTSSTARDKNGFENNVSILRDSTVLDALDEEFDPLTGNLLSRTRKGLFTEMFEYDNMDRLLAVTKKSPDGAVSDGARMTYANSGNILSKSDLGEYTYDEAFKPHAVVGISSDQDWMPTNTLSFAIHPIGTVQSIADDETSHHLDVTYGPDLQRWKSVLTRRENAVRETVFGGAYEKVVESGVTREFYYLDGNVIVVKQDGVFTPYLAMTDNLGSYLAVVDSLGNKVFDAHYDAWGRQHDVTVNCIGLHRGYCGHEMLDEFKLINMNARLYSPCVGRFLSPDNYVQAPDNTQSFNRYSYCLNNPLKYVDPSGELFGVVGGFIRGTCNLFAKGDFLAPIKESWKGLNLDLKLFGGLFVGDFKQNVTRMTWESLQTSIGLFYSEMKLLFHDVEAVEYYDGATYVINKNNDERNGVTLGSYININDIGDLPYDAQGNFAPYMDELYMHEYGHYIQSQEYGYGYLFSVGIPSIWDLSCFGHGKDFDNNGYKKHSLRWFERSANKKGERHFRKVYEEYFKLVNKKWDEKRYPF